VVAIAACGSSSASQASGHIENLTVVLDWTPNTNHAGMYLALSNGWYRQAGLNVKIIQPGDADPLQLLAGGKADVAVSAQESIIPAIAAHLPVVAIAAIVKHNTSSLLSLASEGITVPAMLPGHTYGGYGGALESALVKTLTTCSGGDPSKIRFANVGNADYRVGLTHHQYDFVWIFDGWEKIELTQLDHLAVNTIPFIDHIKCIPDWYTPMLATSRKVMAGRGAALARFMAATKRGYQAAMAHPSDAAAALLKGAPDLDAHLVRLSAAYLAYRFTDGPSAWGHQDLEVWTRFDDFLVKAGLIHKPIDVSAAYTNRYVDAASGSGGS